MSEGIDAAVQRLLETGQALANSNETAARFAFIAHPDDETIKVPCASARVDGNDRIELLEPVLKALEERAPGPTRRSGNTALTDSDSFIAFVKRWGSDETVIYADTARLAFIAVLDDHPAGDEHADTSWRGFRAHYSCPRSPEWLAWTGAEGKAMRQTDFADFIESRLEDMVKIEGAAAPLDMLQVARALHIKTKGTFQREINPTNGDSIFVAKTETTSDSTQIPRAFAIGIPVFEGGERYKLEARVRFAIVEGTPQFSYMLHRRKEVERDAFGAIRNEIVEATARQMLSGTP